MLSSTRGASVTVAICSAKPGRSRRSAWRTTGPACLKTCGSRRPPCDGGGSSTLHGRGQSVARRGRPAPVAIAAQSRALVPAAQHPVHLGATSQGAVWVYDTAGLTLRAMWSAGSRSVLGAENWPRSQQPRPTPGPTSHAASTRSTLEAHASGSSRERLDGDRPFQFDRACRSARQLTRPKVSELRPGPTLVESTLTLFYSWLGIQAGCLLHQIGNMAALIDRRDHDGWEISHGLHHRDHADRRGCARRR